jgi:hypothetical protein
MGSMGSIAIAKDVAQDGIVKSAEKPQYGGSGFASTGSIHHEKEPVSHGIVRTEAKAQYQGATFLTQGSLHHDKEPVQHGIIRGGAKASDGPIDAGSGEIDAAIQLRQQSKRDATTEAKVRAWLAAVLEEKFDDSTPIEELLKSGERICQALNKVYPNAVRSINKSTVAFKQLENIGNYAKACQNLGINKSLIFETADLAESRNLTLVIDNLYHVAQAGARKGIGAEALKSAEASS